MVRIVEEYLRDIADIRATGGGVAETSYYTPLENLFNAIGKGLKPRVRCVMQLKDLGAGNPDGGLFTQDQWNRKSSTPKNPQTPARGVIEAKPVSESVLAIADTKQVSDYWNKYGLVMVTNYREFLLVGKDQDGDPVKLESFAIAQAEDEFWGLVKTPQKTAKVVQKGLEEFLRRAMLHEADISTPQELASFLASYARDALARVEDADLSALDSLREALEESLGMKFKGRQGDHFFRSTLVQTLFYGVFSAWVLWARGRPATDETKFNWRESAWHLKVPLIQALYSQLSQPARLEPLNLVELLDWASAALNRVDRPAFFSAFEDGQAVQHFYEPFLEAFDPQVRKQLGVWYTPPAIVEYMVERVDRVLRSELGIADGLADPSVFVLDPATGTGSDLVEVLKRIRRTLEENGEGALTGSAVRKAAVTRVAGFEILPAPYVIAHLQVGLYLQSIGTPLGESEGERAAVYLTNALTGWEPLDKEKEKAFQASLTGLPDLVEERDLAANVKRDSPILVVIGNPPYNAFDGTSPSGEQDLVERYKRGLITDWGIKKFNLGELYVQFFRVAERRIAQQTGRGVVCYISNFSYLQDPSFVVMRQTFLAEFDSLWVDNMNGDSRQTGKRTPSGNPDPSVFSTQLNKAGIKKGTVVSLLVKRETGEKSSIVRYREFWGREKRSELVDTLNAASKQFDESYEMIEPSAANWYSFKPFQVSADYLSWPTIPDLTLSNPSLGILENRRESLVSIDRSPLEARMKLYFDKNQSFDDVSGEIGGLGSDAARFDAKTTRAKVIRGDDFDATGVRQIVVRPMDIRWCYYTPIRPIWNEPRPNYVSQCWPGNRAFVTRRKGVASPEGPPFNLVSDIGAQHGLNTDAYYVPQRFTLTANPANQVPLLDVEQAAVNVSDAATDYLNSIGWPVHRQEELWSHVLAVGYAPAYLEDNADGLKQDWPRIPISNSMDLLEQSTELGNQVADLLDNGHPVSGVTSGKIRPELRRVGVISTVDGHAMPSTGLRIKAGWGHYGARDIVMPGIGKIVEREWSSEERNAIDEGVIAQGMDLDTAFGQLGETCLDIYLNDGVYWSGIPKSVWGFRIGGYQVIKKWLSYREYSLLGRDLSEDEARHVRDMARRLTAIVLLQPALDENYLRVKNNTYDWNSSPAVHAR